MKKTRLFSVAPVVIYPHGAWAQNVSAHASKCSRQELGPKPAGRAIRDGSTSSGKALWGGDRRSGGRVRKNLSGFG